MHDNLSPPDNDDIQAEQDWKAEWIEEQVDDAMDQLKDTGKIVLHRGTRSEEIYYISNIIREIYEDDAYMPSCAFGWLLFGDADSQAKILAEIKKYIECYFDADKAFDRFIENRDAV
jgi:hypothetical protein